MFTRFPLLRLIFQTKLYIEFKKIQSTNQKNHSNAFFTAYQKKYRSSTLSRPQYNSIRVSQEEKKANVFE